MILDSNEWNEVSKVSRNTQMCELRSNADNVYMFSYCYIYLFNFRDTYICIFFFFLIKMREFLIKVRDSKIYFNILFYLTITIVLKIL